MKKLKDKSEKLKVQNAKRSEGITLVALSITIIILFLLAMVTINIVTNSGIINKTENSFSKYTEEEMKKKIELAYMDLQTEKIYNSNFNEEQFLTLRLEKKFGQGNVSVKKNDKEYIVTMSNGLCYILKKDTVIEGWKKNQDGSYSRKNTSGVQVGDIVYYETELAKTENAVDSTKKAELISDLYTYSDSRSNDYNSDTSIVRENLEWKVLDVKNGQIRLISTVPTSSQIRLYGANGYNNAVYLIDKTCDTLYSIDGLGKAQNLKIEDIEDKLSETGKNARDNYTNPAQNVKYGEEKDYEIDSRCPKIYLSEVGCKAKSGVENTGNNLGLSDQTSPIKGTIRSTGGFRMKQTYWKKVLESEDFIDSKYYTLFLYDEAYFDIYWLSSRCTTFINQIVGYAVSIIDNGCVGRNGLYFSDDGIDYKPHAFRPVVSLEPNVELSGDSTNGWTIQ